MDIRINVHTSGALLSGKGPEIVQKGLDRAITKATMLLDAEVKKRTPQGVFGAQGGLLASIQSAVTGKGTPMVKGIVGTASKYAEVIEKGRTPGKGMPPEGSLLRWLEVKLGMSEREAKRIEFVVRRKIGIKGTKGAFMFQKAFTENRSRIEQIFIKEGLTITMELNNG